MRLRDKVALLAGVGEGMGRATALLFAQEGASVALSARRREHLGETASGIRAAGGNALELPADVAVKSEADRVVGRVVERYGRLDILYCGVGGYFESDREFSEVDERFWREAIDNTASSFYNLAQAVRPVMKDQGGGAIVTIAASFSVRQEANGAYAAAKGAVIGLARNMAKKFVEDNIRVNVIGAGMIKKHLEVGAVSPPRRTLSRTGYPEDIAYASLFLASDEAAWVTGHFMAVDGGVDVGSRGLWEFER